MKEGENFKGLGGGLGEGEGGKGCKLICAELTVIRERIH